MPPFSFLHCSALCSQSRSFSPASSSATLLQMRLFLAHFSLSSASSTLFSIFPTRLHCPWVPGLYGKICFAPSLVLPSQAGPGAFIPPAFLGPSCWQETWLPGSPPPSLLPAARPGLPAPERVCLSSDRGGGCPRCLPSLARRRAERAQLSLIHYSAPLSAPVPSHGWVVVLSPLFSPKEGHI